MLAHVPAPNVQWIKALVRWTSAFIRVTPIGFKPITAGAEIQCAIQLRHGAFFLASGAHPFYKVAPQSLFLASGANPFYKFAPRSLNVSPKLRKINDFHKLKCNLVVF